MQFFKKMHKKTKSQDVFHNICRVRDSEHNKNKHCSRFIIVGFALNSKIVRKLRFL